MDKNAIKKYAVWARNELIARVTQKAEQYEITEKKTTPKDADSINGRLLTDAEKNQRKALIEKIQADGFEQVMEEVAYTWFNRFTALRFMEVNNYLPSHTRVFTNETGEFKPQILTDAIQLDLEGLDMDKVFELKDANKTEELYKYLLITQCNALSAVLPRMFQKIEHYTELLLPDYLLREGSVIEQMITLIPEEDWTDQVQIIGWLYQYYNSEPKDAVFAALKKNVKISKDNIPAATQLFTPDWIVRYMVENSLGRLWLEGHPNDNLKSEWKYYLDEAEQEANVQRQLDTIRKEYADLKPEDIRCIDPCMGSGHILCYMFDVLVKIYEDYGYTAREAAENIITKNLWGLDIDERAAQLSYFAVMMKARQYDRRFLTRGIQPHVYAIEESNGITSAPMHDMGIELSQEEYGKAAKEAMRLVEELHDAKEYGSIIQVTPCDWELLRRFAIPRGHGEGQMRMDIHGEIEASDRLQVLINIGEVLSQKYHIVVTNPPYMGAGGMSNLLSKFVRENYPDSKQDMFSVFIERCYQMVKPMGCYALITQPSMLFLASFEKLRNKIINEQNIINLIHMGRGIFGIDFGSTAFVIRKMKLSNYTGVYQRLHERTFQYIEPEDIEKLFLLGKRYRALHCDFLKYDTETGIMPCIDIDKKNNVYFEFLQQNFNKIPGTPFAYWLSDKLIDIFGSNKLSDVCETRKGLATSDNNRFLRMWYEVALTKVSFNCDSNDESAHNGKKWFPINKGGDFCRWYGNFDYLINWENDGYEIRNFRDDNGKLLSRPQNLNYNFKQALTWSKICSATYSARMCFGHSLFDDAAAICYHKDIEYLYYILGFLNSKVCQSILKIYNPTMNVQIGDIGNLPIIALETKDDIIKLVKENIEIATKYWNSKETSWGFEKHPMLYSNLVQVAYEHYVKSLEEALDRMTRNEEIINKLFISGYGLEDELSSTVNDEEKTIEIKTEKEYVIELISYAVGCMFGRYSLDENGIVYAGGAWDGSKYSKFKPDLDGIIPICDDEYFEDDIVGRFIDFLKTAYGADTVEENLNYIANVLGGKGQAREVIRNYFLNDFFKEHCNMYSITGSGKRPIYWLFDSGKRNGFKCLVYIHRYQPDTIARIRTDYVHEQQSRYRTAITDLENRINGAGTSERVKLNKQLTSLQAQATEIREYEEKIHHLADQMISIDLDDGVKHNYEIFKDVLAKIK